MKLDKFLKEHSDTIAENWLDQTFKTYPIDTVGFMRGKSNEFDNPVGTRTRQAIKSIAKALTDDSISLDEVKDHVDTLIRLRAVQDFTPARAVGIFYLLKPIVRGLVEKHKERDLYRDLLLFESKIDSLALIAFDVYTECRDKIFSMRVDEIKHRHANLLRKARMVCDDQAEEPDTPPT